MSYIFHGKMYELPPEDVSSYCDKMYHLLLVGQRYNTPKPNKRHSSLTGTNPIDDAR